MIWRNYRWNEGMVTFVLSRISAILVSFYLLTHILVIRSLGLGPENFNRMMEMLSKPVFKLLELGLVGIIIVHVLQGFRVILFNLGVKSKYRRNIFIVFLSLAIILFVVSAYYLLPFKI